MRESTHTATLPNGETIDVFKLMELLKGREAEEIALSEIHGRDRSKKTGFSPVSRYPQADTSFPGIVDENNYLLDGRHRLFKQLDQGAETGMFQRATPEDIQAALLKEASMTPTQMLLLKEAAKKKKQKALRRRVEVIAKSKDGRIFGGTYPDKTFGVFGGGIESGETIEEAARREFLEETGRRIHDVKRLKIDPVENPWPKSESPYASDEDKAKDNARYRGDKTYYVEATVTPGRERKNKDFSHLTRIGFHKCDTAKRKLEDIPGDKVYQKLKKGRLKALKEVMDKEEKDKEEKPVELAKKSAFLLGFETRMKELSNGRL